MKLIDIYPYFIGMIIGGIMILCLILIFGYQEETKDIDDLLKNKGLELECVIYDAYFDCLAYDIFDKEIRRHHSITVIQIQEGFE